MKVEKISGRSVLRCNVDGFVVRRLPDEMVIMSLETGHYISINEVGAEIWGHLQEPKTLNLLLNTLQEEYSLSGDQWIADVQAFLQQLISENALLVLEQ